MGLVYVLQATALLYFKRFYLQWSVMEHDPKHVMCVFFFQISLVSNPNWANSHDYWFIQFIQVGRNPSGYHLKTCLDMDYSSTVYWMYWIPPLFDARYLFHDTILNEK